MKQTELIESYHNQARTFLRDGKLSEAMTICQKALALDAELATTHHILGSIQQAQGNFKDAQESYQKSIEINPNLAENYINLADIALQQEDWKTAIDFYEKALNIQPNQARIYFNLSTAYQKLDNQNASIENWYKALVLQPSWGNANDYFILGNQLLSLDKLTEASHCYRQAIALNPDLFAGYQNLGETLNRQEKYEEAIQFFEQAIRIDSTYFQPYASLGNAWSNLGEFDKAIASFNQAIEMSPNAFYLYHNLGGIWLQLKQWEKARLLFEQAIKLSPDTPYLYYYVGECWRQLEEWEKAIEYYQKTTELDANIVETYQRLGLIWLNLRNYPRAFAAYELGLNKHPNSGLLYHSLCYLHYHLGNLDEALKYLEKAIELEPNKAAYYNYLGQILLRKNQLNEAIIALRQAIKLEPNAPWVNFFLAKVLTKQDNWDEAIKFYLKCAEIQLDLPGLEGELGGAWHNRVKLSSLDETINYYMANIPINQDNSQFYFDVGEMLEKAGHFAGAIIAYNIAKHIKPDFPNLEAKLTENLAKSQELEAEINSYRQQIALHPNNSGAYNKLGNTLGKIGETQDAAICHQTVAKLRNWPQCMEREYEFTYDWFTHNIATWEKYLRQLAEQPLQILEIGSYEGMSTCWFLDEILTHPESKISSIDIYFQDNFSSNMIKTKQQEKIIKLEGNSQKILPTLATKYYDIAYIDGCHLATSAFADSILAWDLVKRGGIIIFDDYEYTYPDEPEQNTKIGIEAFLSLVEPQVKRLDLGYQLIIQKISDAPNEMIHNIAKIIAAQVREPQELTATLKNLIQDHQQVAIQK